VRNSLEHQFRKAERIASQLGISRLSRQPGSLLLYSKRGSELRTDDSKSETALKRVEVVVAVKQRMALSQTESRYSYTRGSALDV